jgi:hypothetical protein
MGISADVHRSQVAGLRQLAALHPWPENTTASEGDYTDMLLPTTDRAMLAGIIPHEAVLLLVVGISDACMLRYLCDLALAAAVVAIVTPEDAPTYDAFVAQMHYYKRQVIPICMDAGSGIRCVHDAGLLPAAVYYNTGVAKFEQLYGGLSTAITLFPAVINVGSAWGTADVRKAVDVVTERCGRERDVFEESIWLIHERGWERTRRRTRRRQQ